MIKPVASTANITADRSATVSPTSPTSNDELRKKIIEDMRLLAKYMTPPMMEAMAPWVGVGSSLPPSGSSTHTYAVPRVVSRLAELLRSRQIAPRDVFAINRLV